MSAARPFTMYNSERYLRNQLEPWPTALFWAKVPRGGIMGTKSATALWAAKVPRGDIVGIIKTARVQEVAQRF